MKKSKMYVVMLLAVMVVSALVGLWNEKFKWRGYGSNNWMECGRS